MEAPKGVEINAEAGNMEATCRTELRLESKDGEVGAEKDRSPERCSYNKPAFPQAGWFLPVPLKLILRCKNPRSQPEGFIWGTDMSTRTTISQTHNTFKLRLIICNMLR